MRLTKVFDICLLKGNSFCYRSSINCNPDGSSNKTGNETEFSPFCSFVPDNHIVTKNYSTTSFCLVLARRVRIFYVTWFHQYDGSYRSTLLPINCYSGRKIKTRPYFLLHYQANGLNHLHLKPSSKLVTDTNSSMASSSSSAISSSPGTTSLPTSHCKYS